jgi:hypothetical protein
VSEALRTQYLNRWNALKNERSSWMTHWRELSDYYLPRSGRFFTRDVNKGDKRWNNIYDSTGTRSLRILAAGMMAGMTSPARPWFRLATPDSALMEHDPVKLWLNEVTKRMRLVFARSNTYRSLHNVYEELGLFGTAASIVVPDYDTLVRHHPLTAGEYALAADNRREICTLYREFEMTVSQMVREFGLEKCSKTVQNLYKNGGKGLDTWVTVVHVIEPRYDRDTTKRTAQNMPYASSYFEMGGGANEVLRESGFNEFPVVAPRWGAVSGDVYGFSPGMEALGDVKQLQHQQLKKAEAIEYKVNPPLAVPTSLVNSDIDRLPGGIVYADNNGQQGGIRSLYDVNLDLSHLREDIGDVRQRINQAFYADLFLMLANDDRSNITAREVAERHEEKLLMLGPVLERLHNEMLDPLIDITFSRMVSSGMLADLPPPRELQGMDLKVEFVSTLAQAQRAVGVQAVDRLLGTVGAIAPMRPDVLDKLDTDQLIDAYADMLGVDPTLIVADDRVAIIRRDRAQQQQAQQAAAMMQPTVDAAHKLSQTPTGNDSALDSVMSMFQGYGQ